MTTALWLALRFPHWPLDSRTGETADGSWLVVETRGSRCFVVAATADAVAAGVRHGMDLADARLRQPDAGVLSRRPAGERAALTRLAGWAWQYSDHVHLACAGEPPYDTAGGSHLVFEIGASLRLFGGRRALRRRIAADLKRFGHRHAAGIDSTPQAALARTRAPRSRARTERVALPLSCLALDAATLASLQASGFRTLGELLALPPATLMRRYGAALLDDLDRLQGHRPHGLPLYRLPARYRTRHELTGAVVTTQGLVFVLRRVLADLAAFLRGADAAIQHLRLILIHEDDSRTRLDLRLNSPAHDAAHFERVVNDRLARVELTAPVVEIGLASERLRRREQAQSQLLSEAARPGVEPGAWPAVLDRLRARLGHDAVGWLHAPDAHRPEKASATGDRPPIEAPTGNAMRPLWLYAHPRPITAPETLTFIAGPERVESGWWDAQAVRRDYYRARDRRGRLLWIYRDLDAARGGPSPYYLHGLFG